MPYCNHLSGVNQFGLKFTAGKRTAAKLYGDIIFCIDDVRPAAEKASQGASTTSAQH
jgi:hypothetical protein